MSLGRGGSRFTGSSHYTGALRSGVGSKTREPRAPGVSRLMALAIRLDGLICAGVVTDQAELARLGHVTRARLTQIMNLLCLAPDIQEQILFLPPSTRGRDEISERQLRPIAATPDWRKQRQDWGRLSTTCVGTIRQLERV